MSSFLTSIGLLFFSITALAQGPGAEIDRVYDEIRDGHEACGLTYVRGDDVRLHPQIRARNVDEVIAYVYPNGALNPGVLVDWHIRRGQDRLELQYTRLNGAHLLGVSREYFYDDLEVTTSYGQLMHTTTANHGGEVRTTHWVRSRRVTPEYFTETLNVEVIYAFVDFVCPR